MRMRIVKACTLALVLGVGLLGLSISAQAAKIPRDNWLKVFRAAFPAEVCDHYGNLFMDPYGLDHDGCLKLVLRSLDYCLEFSQELLPAEIDLPAEGQAWGSVLGECAGGSYEAAMKPRLKKKS
jgi:hypothetical protein